MSTKYIMTSTILLFAIISCEMDITTLTNSEISKFISPLPKNVLHPSNNPYTSKKEELGRLLFWDPVLSGTKEVSCASCHHPNLGYADGLLFSQGVEGTGLGPERTGGMLTKRNAPTVINTAFNGINNNGNYNPSTAPMFWDNRATDLEGQALLPMLSKEEMRGELIAEDDIMDTVIQRLNNIPDYKSRFLDAFGSDEINQDKILKAIATFERSIIANNSRFDQYMRGNQNIMTELEKQGMSVFIQVGCADCHSGAMLSDYKLHTIGIPDNISPPDKGGNGTFNFRTPTLRNLALTAPYMHNGLHSSLQEVMDFYANISEGEGDGGDINSNLNPNQLDEEIQNLELDEEHIEVILAFLNTLNDNDFDKIIPASVPSGLPVGGKINN